VPQTWSGRSLSAPVKQKWFSACRPFLKWTIEESSAPTVIALGRCAYDSVVRAYECTPVPFRDAVEAGSPIPLGGQRLLFAVFHPAARPKDRTLQQMQADWDRIGKYPAVVWLPFRLDADILLRDSGDSTSAAQVMR
jgi:uracil-DNA glycosylase